MPEPGRGCLSDRGSPRFFGTDLNANIRQIVLAPQGVLNLHLAPKVRYAPRWRPAGLLTQEGVIILGQDLIHEGV